MRHTSRLLCAVLTLCILAGAMPSGVLAANHVSLLSDSLQSTYIHEITGYSTENINAKRTEPGEMTEEIVEHVESSNTNGYTITLNGEAIQHSVEPQTYEGKLFIPLLPILRALHYDVNWLSGSKSLIAVRNGTVIKAYAGSKDAIRKGTAVTLSEEFQVIDGAPYGAAAFLLELYDVTVTENTEEHSVSITAEIPKYVNWFGPNSFAELGTWTRQNDNLIGISTKATLEEAQTALANGELNPEPAILKFTVPEDGTYRLWVSARDFTTNQPGARSFNAKIDQKMSGVLFGQHAKNGSGKDGQFVWEDGGLFTLTAGEHTVYLLDTSCFFARCQGVIISEDPFNPNSDINSGIVIKNDPAALLDNPTFPTWAKGSMPETSKEVSIENETTKIVFYAGSDEDGHAWVQNEIFLKVENEWRQTKARTEELGWLMLDALQSEIAVTTDEGQSAFRQTIRTGNTETTISTDNFFYTGNPTWLIPQNVEKNENEAVLTFEPNDKATITVKYGFDDLCSDVKVTLEAAFKQEGNYSFLLYSGDPVEYESFERVTAPLLFVKKAMPSAPGIVTMDSWLFTPMSTFTYPEGTVVANSKFTSGIVMDPSYISVEQQFTYPDTARFGTVFTTADGNRYRNQMVAPIFGTEDSRFAEGDTFSVAYRIIARNEDWFDCYKHITQDIYNLGDYRENYYTSLNEAIYNTADILKDEKYSGWDDEMLGFYNIERKGLVSQSNPLVIMQQYLLTEDDELLEKRVIPTMAYMLTRKSTHFMAENYSEGSAGYVTDPPSKIGSPVSWFGTNVYGGMYEMTQGRVPFFLQYALENVNGNANLAGIEATAALYRYANSTEKYATEAARVKKTVEDLADKYMESAPPFVVDQEKGIMNVFVYNDYIDPVAAFLTAYSVTGSQKYLEAAKQSAMLLTTSVWTTGYQNDNLNTDTTLSAEKTLERLTNVDKGTADFFWYGTEKWRPGDTWTSVTERDLSPQEWAALYPEKAQEILGETVPSWVLAKAGLGTEHVRTPGHGNVVTMNAWAGNLEKLAALTGEDYFEMLSRNAILGRFSDYPGYYIDRNLTYEMKEKWYTDGPDFTNVYWHHIPIFLAILEDYLINSVQIKSVGNIDFPAVVENGYAYFTTNQYGQAPGKFYDEDNMWLWLDRGIIEIEEKNLDYIAARKDGVLGMAFVNEKANALTTTIRLGEKIVGGNNYNGIARVFDANGNTSELIVINGSFTLSIPAKGLAAVILDIPDVTAPKYAKSYTISNAIGETVSTHTDGKAYLLQMTDDEYYSYVYTDRMASKDDATGGIDKLVMNYTVGDGTVVTDEDSTYPFEFIVKVTEPSKSFSYTLTAYRGEDSIALGGGTLSTLQSSATRPELNIPNAVIDKYTPIEDAWTGESVAPIKLPDDAYVGASGGAIRIRVKKSAFAGIEGCEQDVEPNALRGLKIYGIFSNENGANFVLDSWIIGNENRTDSSKELTLICQPTEECPIQNFDRCKPYKLAVGTADNSTGDFIAALNGFSDVLGIELTLKDQSYHSTEILFTVDRAQFADDLKQNDLIDQLLNIYLIDKGDGTANAYQRPVTSATITENAVILAVSAQDGLEAKNYAGTHTIRLGFMPIFESKCATTGNWQGNLRLVINKSTSPLVMTANQLAFMKVYVFLEHKVSGETKWLETTVESITERNANEYNVQVYPSTDVPGKGYQSEYKIRVAFVDPAHPLATLDGMKEFFGMADIQEPKADGFAIAVNSVTTDVDKLHITVPRTEFVDEITADRLNNTYVSVALWNEADKESVVDTLNVDSALIGENIVTLNLDYGEKLTRDSAWNGAKIQIGVLSLLQTTSSTTGTASGRIKIVIPQNRIPSGPIVYDLNELVGMNLCMRLDGKANKETAGTTLWLVSQIITVAERSDGGWDLVVDATDEVPYQTGNYYSINYNLTLALAHKSYPVNLRQLLELER